MRVKVDVMAVPKSVVTDFTDNLPGAPTKHAVPGSSNRCYMAIRHQIAVVDQEFLKPALVPGQGRKVDVLVSPQRQGSTPGSRASHPEGDASDQPHVYSVICRKAQNAVGYRQDFIDIRMHWQPRF